MAHHEEVSHGFKLDKYSFNFFICIPCHIDVHFMSIFPLHVFVACTIIACVRKSQRSSLEENKTCFICKLSIHEK